MACRKRWGSFTLAATRHTYAQIVAMDAEQAAQLLVVAAQYSDAPCLCWAFESICIRASGDERQVWRQVVSAAAAMPETVGLFVLETVLDKYGPVLAELEEGSLNAQGNYLLGKVFSKLAFAAKGSSKGTMQLHKKNSLLYLGRAREQLKTQGTGDPGIDPYREAASVAALAALVATAYEGAAYLQWKGTRTTALSE